MTAPHFFVADVSGDRVVIEGPDAQHGVRALRLREGETITVSDDAGTVVTAKVVSAGAALEAEVLGRRTMDRDRPRLTVYQALPKHPKIEEVVRRLAEAGAAEVVPFAAVRSVAKWDQAKAESRLQRLRRIAREAAMSARRPFITQVGPPARLDDVPAGALVLHEEASLGLVRALPTDPPEAITLVVGPEGGLAPEEVTSLATRGCAVVSLGPGIFRSEISAFVGICAIMARYGLLG